MYFKKLSIEGLLLVTPNVFKDERGYFFESFNQNEFTDYLGEKISFVQDNQSKSKKHTIRGLHFQKKPFAQGKLVRVLSGEIFDAVVDLRQGSKTFGKSLAVKLNSESFKALYVPEGFAHGFQVVSESATVSYKTTNFYNAESELTIAWDDPKTKIKWPNSTSPNLSKKDQLGLQLDNLLNKIQGEFK
jgi:dTDP-4-dehydrorhamnose 3,5-epimerase|tara:strand:- start:1428 stop:1991 length:564 start_codon:yes stop_codon:yes gene_type:complete